MRGIESRIARQNERHKYYAFNNIIIYKYSHLAAGRETESGVSQGWCSARTLTSQLQAEVTDRESEFCNDDATPGAWSIVSTFKWK